MNCKTKTHARVPRVKMLPVCLALALSFSSADAAPDPTLRTGRQWANQPQGLDESPLANRFPIGDPRSVAINEALSRKRPARPEGGVSLPVLNCNDSGAGSLRDVIADAADGDTVDFSTLTCSTITLTSGGIITGADNLTLQASTAVTIDGQHLFPVLVHVGTGTLTVGNLNLKNGAKYSTGSDNAPGACVYSSGSVVLDGSSAKYCNARADGTGIAQGGGVFAQGSVGLISSTIASNMVESAGNFSRAGGVFANAGLSSVYSTIKYNSATVSSSGDLAYSGGAQTFGNSVILNSTISGNTADSVGGLNLIGTTQNSILNSTLSGNVSANSYYGSALYASGDTVITNSTISGNTEKNPANQKYGAGINGPSTGTVELVSSIVSGNFIDDGTTTVPSDINVGVLTGNTNLIGISANTVPGDTIVSIDPGLGPLSILNGGPTSTMALLPGSPALNAGSNPGNKYTDQRGPGYPRVIGSNVDIGAFESDILFADGFD